MRTNAMSKKKVIIIGSAYPLRGGLATYNERLARAFISEDYDVKIHTFSLQYPSFLFPGKSQYSSAPKPEDLDIDISVNSINPINWIVVGKKIKREKPDFVIMKFWLPFVAPSLGTIARIIRKNKHTKIITIVDNMIPHEKRIGDKLFASYFAKSVDGFVAMSKSVLSDIKQFDTSKPKEFCPHPLYDNFGDIESKKLACSKIKLDQNVNYLLFFGFIRHYKGLDILLKAFADERLRKFNVKLIIAGEYYVEQNYYDEIIRELNIREHLVFRNDFIPDNEVAHYFNAADMVVQPYKTATQSGVTQIAYHFNKPMLVTDVGGLAEIVPNEKVGYVTPIDVSKISDALVNFYEKNRKNFFAKNASEIKKQYSWKRMIENIENIYKEIKQ